jgi:hypothetical protein
VQITYQQQVSETVDSERVLPNQRRLLLFKVDATGVEEKEGHPLPDDAFERLNQLFKLFIDVGLPNGRWRIYLQDPDYPRRFLMEFSKWGDSIGEPVQEPGPGSNPRENGHSDTPAQPTVPENKIDPGGSSMDLRPAMQKGSTPMWELLGKLGFPLTGLVLLGLAGSRRGSQRPAPAGDIDKALEASRPNSFSRGARLRRAWLRTTRHFPLLESDHGDLPELPKRSE